MAPRFTPLLGAALGAVGAGAYWIGAQLWPTSIAVVLSMAATALLSAAISKRAGGAWSAALEELGPGAKDQAADPRGTAAAALCIVFAVLIKYNALMALSAASLPYPLPANLALGLIMIAAHAASRALLVSVLASTSHAASKPVALGDLCIALATGFAPAALIGIPGLIGLAAAIVARIVFIGGLRRARTRLSAAELGMTQPLTEICFYLGAAAARTYV
jgi:adenosylcobinamide-GDP ribazoletransferase